MMDHFRLFIKLVKDEVRVGLVSRSEDHNLI